MPSSMPVLMSSTPSSEAARPVLAIRASHVLRNSASCGFRLRLQLDVDQVDLRLAAREMLRPRPGEHRRPTTPGRPRCRCAASADPGGRIRRPIPICDGPSSIRPTIFRRYSLVPRITRTSSPSFSPICSADVLLITAPRRSGCSRVDPRAFDQVVRRRLGVGADERGRAARTAHAAGPTGAAADRPERPATRLGSPGAAAPASGPVRRPRLPVATAACARPSARPPSAGPPAESARAGVGIDQPHRKLDDRRRLRRRPGLAATLSTRLGVDGWRLSGPRARRRSRIGPDTPTPVRRTATTSAS